MRMIRPGLVPLAAAMAALSTAQFEATRVVAVVNGEEIKAPEYYRRVETLDLADLSERYGTRMLALPAGYLALEQMITEKIVFQLAKQKGALPSEPELKFEIEKLNKETPKALEGWLASGRTLAEFEARARFKLTFFKLQSFGITVTNQEVEKFYKDNPTIFTDPKKVKLHVISLDDPTKRTIVDEEMKKGATFEQAAKKYSNDVSRLQDGDYGTLEHGLMAPAIRKAIDAVKVGQLTEWVLIGGKALRFRLDAVIPPKLHPIEDDMRYAIRKRLLLDRGRVKNNIEKELTAKRKASVVDIKIKEYADIYKRFLDNVK